MNIISTGILKIFRIDLSQKVTQITEDELMTIFDVSHEEGVLESEERKMIRLFTDFRLQRSFPLL